MVFAKGTDKGRIRDNNEDCLYADGKLFVIADGMGGHNAGEVASKMAVDSVTSVLTKEVSNEKMEMKRAYAIANTLIYKNSKDDQKGMGTTLDVCFLNNDTLHIGHVGDSRVYIISGGEIEKITTDHSYIEMLLLQGQITPEEAEQSPNKHVITRAIGVDEQVEMDYYQRKLSDKDILLMCSDGLSDMLPEKDMLDIILLNAATLDYAVKKLIDAANENGGQDNISVIIAGYSAKEE
ncbi:MAG: Stp1/IreP family PP2C-type Ser/Thr phosphatase [Bacillota bacterium]|nr:Stp1/IreP family PP2C-type Ser/Thr phosphatase [Bacillota bacterium]